MAAADSTTAAAVGCCNDRHHHTRYRNHHTHTHRLAVVEVVAWPTQDFVPAAWRHVVYTRADRQAATHLGNNDTHPALASRLALAKPDKVLPQPLVQVANSTPRSTPNNH